MLDFLSLKRLQIRTKYFSERPINLEQNLETCYLKVQRKPCSVLFRKSDWLNMMASTCFKIYNMFNRRKNLIALWCHHFHLEKWVKMLLKIIFFPNIWPTTQKTRKLINGTMSHVTRNTWTIFMTTSVYELKGENCKISFFLMSYIQFSFTERNPKCNRISSYFYVGCF